MVAAKGAKEGDNGWMKGLEGIGGILKRMPGVTIYQVRPHPDVHPATRPNLPGVTHSTNSGGPRPVKSSHQSSTPRPAR